eukprot:TRINITY_DN6124_c0_g1_i1.p5 TRINITY_DN6124_c0_g1~~TRINITY_DN6124_c0_g1_i1.p5  ORF type:complete len:293 (+),score=83.18 TRINITY_DN6124_c0_g1_i1:49-927(+)
MADDEYNPADEYEPAAEYEPSGGDVREVEAKHFLLEDFSGRLGLGLSSGMEVTLIHDGSPCKAAGLPTGVRLTHVCGVRVESTAEVGAQLGTLTEDGRTKGVVLSVVPAADEYPAEWWAGVKGNVAAERREEEEYDPLATALRVEGTRRRRSSSPGSDSDAPPPAKRTRAATPPPADGLHPCLRKGRACGENCPYRLLPLDACVHFCRGTCSFGDKCRWQHVTPHKPHSPLPPDCAYACNQCCLAIARQTDIASHLRSLAHVTLAQRSREAAMRSATVSTGVRALMSRLRSS